MPEFINEFTGEFRIANQRDDITDDWNYIAVEDLTLPKLAEVLGNVVSRLNHVEQLLERHYQEFEYHTGYNTRDNLHAT